MKASGITRFEHGTCRILHRRKARWYSSRNSDHSNDSSTHNSRTWDISSRRTSTLNRAATTSHNRAIRKAAIHRSSNMPRSLSTLRNSHIHHSMAVREGRRKIYHSNPLWQSGQTTKHR